jgi:hypothetical protein
VPRKVWFLAIIVVAVALLVAAQNSTVRFPDLSSYRVAGPRTLAITAAVAACSWTRVTGVTESETEVRVRVETLPCLIPFAHTDALDLRELNVSLANDLGTRRVADDRGQMIPDR